MVEPLNTIYYKPKNKFLNNGKHTEIYFNIILIK